MTLHFEPLKFWIILLTCHFISASQTHDRPRRGASIYPVFNGGSSGHGSQNKYFFNDPTPFIQYLGGGGSSGGHSASPSASTYSYVTPQQPSRGHSGNSGTSFDTNALNAYTLSMNSHSPASTTAAPSTSYGGWTPIVGQGRGGSSNALGYGGSFYTSHFGLLNPNFAHTNSPTTRSSHRPVHVPTLDANVLASAAQTSFYAQNGLYDALLAGSRPSTYKGSSSY